MPSRPLHWQPDDTSAAILAAYGRRGDRPRDVLRRALLLLAHADGLLDTRGNVRAQHRPRRVP